MFFSNLIFNVGIVVGKNMEGATFPISNYPKYLLWSPRNRVNPSFFVLILFVVILRDNTKDREPKNDGNGAVAPPIITR